MRNRVRVSLVSTLVLSAALAACSGGSNDSAFRPGSGPSGTQLVGTTTSSTVPATSFGASLTPSDFTRLYALRVSTDPVAGTVYDVDIYSTPLTATSRPATSVPIATMLTDANGAQITPTGPIAVDRSGNVVTNSQTFGGLLILSAPLSNTSATAVLVPSPVALSGAPSNVGLAFDSTGRLWTALGAGLNTISSSVNRLQRFSAPISAASVPNLTIDVGPGLPQTPFVSALAVGPADAVIVYSNPITLDGAVVSASPELLEYKPPYAIVPSVIEPIVQLGTANQGPINDIATDANGSVYAAGAEELSYYQGPLFAPQAATGATNGAPAIASPVPITLSVSSAAAPKSVALDSSGALYVVGGASTAISMYRRPLQTFSAPTSAIPCTGTACSFLSIAFGP